MPDNDQRLLVGDIKLYVLPSADNVLYVQVTNVVTTEGAFWFGTAFDDVTQTGVRITFPDSSLLTFGVAFSSSFANPGEILADGTSGTEVVTPLSDTPGFALQATDSALLIYTTSGANNGFTSLCCIKGATRIRGGGVFQLTFAQSVDFANLDFSKLMVESEYGRGNQYILANPTDNIPPTTLATALPGPNTNGWNNTNVTVNMNATDNPGGSGVKQIQFALAGAQNTSWQTVAGNAASVIISAEGTTILSYYAIDNAGNLETSKTLTVRIDKSPPISRVSALPATETSVTFPVRWSGADGGSGMGSGIQNFTIYASDNGGLFAPWLTNTTATQATYTGVAGHTYGFYSIARDLAGNVEKSKSTADTSTLIPAASLSLWENTTMDLGQTVILPVTISKAAPSGGVTVTLISSDPSKVKVVTPNVFFPAGRTVPNAEPWLTGVNLGGVTITASAPGYLSDTQSATVPGSIRFVRCCVTVLGTTATQVAVLDLSGPAPVGGLTVNLSSDNPGVATVPATVTFPANAKSVNVPIKGVTNGSTVIHASALPNLAVVSIKVTVE